MVSGKDDGDGRPIAGAEVSLRAIVTPGDDEVADDQMVESLAGGRRRGMAQLLAACPSWPPAALSYLPSEPAGSCRGGVDAAAGKDVAARHERHVARRRHATARRRTGRLMSASPHRAGAAPRVLRGVPWRLELLASHVCVPASRRTASPSGPCPRLQGARCCDLQVSRMQAAQRECGSPARKRRPRGASCRSGRASRSAARRLSGSPRPGARARRRPGDRSRRCGRRPARAASSS